MELTKVDLLNLVKGASILTTGGGLCLSDQLESLKKHQDISLELKDLSDFDDDDILITASEVGTADAKEMDKTNIIPKMLVTWEKLTGQKISGVYAPEIGQESIIIDTAIGMGVPLVDFDVAGGRAVPFVDINSFFAIGLNFSLTPMVVASDQGDIIAVDSIMPINKAELFLRPLTNLSKGGIAFFIGGSVRVGDIRQRGIQNNSLSTSIKLGSAKQCQEIESILNPYLILKGNVISKRKISKNGFNCFEAEFKSDIGEVFSLFILNEVLFIKDKSGNNIITPPDKILIFNEQDLTGVSTKEFLSGKNVTLYGVKADKIWSSETALKIFGEDRFN